MYMNSLPSQPFVCFCSAQCFWYSYAVFPHPNAIEREFYDGIAKRMLWNKLATVRS
jgi:hypothetical protein